MKNILNINSIINVKATRLGMNGEGVCTVVLDKENEKTPFVVFVPYLLPEESAQVRIVEIKKSYAVGKIIKRLDDSIFRIDPICPYYQECGGCDLQHLKYSEALKFKTDLVKNNFKKISNLDVDVNECKNLGKANAYRYRNKITFSIGSDTLPQKSTNLKLSLLAKNTYNPLPVEDCLITGDWVKEYIKIFNNFFSESKLKLGVISKVMFRNLNNTTLILVSLNTIKLPKIDLLLEALKATNKNFGLYTMDKNNNLNFIIGSKSILQNINGIKFKVGTQSFLQVNLKMQDLIYNEVIDLLDKNATVINCYSGAGLLSAIVAKKCNNVIGIESNREAGNASINLALANKINNMQSITGTVEDNIHKVCSQFKNKKLNIILDPPRKGVDKKTLKTILETKPDKIIYISCNSATLARDIKYYLDESTNKFFCNYKITKLIPYDMFCQTCHVETLCVLEKVVNNIL